MNWYVNFCKVTKLQVTHKFVGLKLDRPTSQVSPYTTRQGEYEREKVLNSSCQN